MSPIFINVAGLDSEVCFDSRSFRFHANVMEPWHPEERSKQRKNLQNLERSFYASADCCMCHSTFTFGYGKTMLVG